MAGEHTIRGLVKRDGGEHRERTKDTRLAVPRDRDGQVPMRLCREHVVRSAMEVQADVAIFVRACVLPPRFVARSLLVERPLARHLPPQPLIRHPLAADLAVTGLLCVVGCEDAAEVAALDAERDGRHDAVFRSREERAELEHGSARDIGRQADERDGGRRAYRNRAREERCE